MRPFRTIAGQIVRSKVLEAYHQEAFVLSKIVGSTPTRYDGEKIPGIGRIAENVSEVRPGMPYPNLGFGEDYVETPQTTKRGFIVPITKEAIYFDRTNLILQRAAEAGEVLGLNKEKRLLDLLIGATNNYNWKGVIFNTYSETGTGTAPDGDWINQIDVELRGLDRCGRGGAKIRRDTRSEHGRAGSDSSDDGFGDARPIVMPRIAYLARPKSPTARSADRERRPRRANPLGNYRVAESRLGLPTHRCVGNRGGEGEKILVHRRFQEGLRLYGKLADHRHGLAAEQRGPISIRTSSFATRRANAERPRSSIRVTSFEAPEERNEQGWPRKGEG